MKADNPFVVKSLRAILARRARFDVALFSSRGDTM